MGNKIARTTQGSATDYYLHDLPTAYNLVFIKVAGRGRFLKSAICKHDEGQVLLKVYFKRGEPVQLKEYERQLATIRDVFLSIQHSHVWPFQFWFETDKAAYLLRQYFFSNLHDRLSIRPFLNAIEKKWLAFQLLCAVEQCHSKGICHGDIKCENVLVTSWNWLYLADFASFKPTYIPHDDPSDFSFFFDTGGRRRCYLAPERFYEPGGETQIAHDSTLKPSMDIFSLGCVIAELFLEGQPLFELSQLLAYRRGQYDPKQSLEKIQDVGIQNMILHMIQLDPGLRLPCEGYLQNFASAVFPNYFSPFLHKFFSCMIPLDPDTRVDVTQTAFQKIHEEMIMSSSSDIAVMGSFGRTVIDAPGSFDESESIVRPPEESVIRENKLERGINFSHMQLGNDLDFFLRKVDGGNGFGSREPVESIQIYSGAKGLASLEPLNHERKRSMGGLTGQKRSEVPRMRQLLKSDLHSVVSGYDSQSDTYNFDYFLGTEFKTDCEGMVLIASLLCSCIRSVKQPQLRRAGLLLIKNSSYHIGDDERLQHVVPVVVGLLSDSAAMVRCAALETLSDILSLVRDFPPSDAMIFPEYILPMLSMLQTDPEESVRICYASNIYKIAIAAYRFLVQSCGLVRSLDSGLDTKEHSSSSVSPSLINQDKSAGQLKQLRRSISETVQELVMGPKQTPSVRRALMQDIGYLCYFFGHKQSNEFLLPILPAFLNDRDDQLRAMFFGKIVFVCYFVGQRSVEEYLLPYLEQALNDEMEPVILNVLECLSMLCKSNYLRKSILCGLISKAVPLLCFPLQCVRKSAVTFITACNESLGPVDSYVYLSPALSSYLRREPPSLSSVPCILSCLKPFASSKSIFYEGLEKVDSSDMLERQRKIWYSSSTNLSPGRAVDHGKFGRESSVKNAGDDSRALSVRRPPTTSQSNSLTVMEHARKASSSSTSLNSDFTEKLLFADSLPSHFASGNRSFYEGLSKEIPLYSGYIDSRINAMSMVSDPSSHFQNLQISSRLPLPHPVGKPGSLSYSVQPKIVQGSYFNVASSSIHGVKLSKDQEHRDNSSSTNISSKFHDITVYDNTRSNSTIAEDVSQSEITASPLTRGLSFSDAGWKPRGTLVAHLQEHRSAVNSVAISNDNTFFVSASDDSTVKIWETRRLEKDISFRSRLTYSLGGGRALCANIVRGTSQVVTGSSDGVLHLFPIDHTSRNSSGGDKSSDIAEMKRRDIREGAIHSIVNCSPSDGWINQTIIYSTENCGMHIWDTRLSSENWNFKSKPEEGYISSLVMGACGNWFVSGSSRGFLTLWDLRFLLPVYSWQHSSVPCRVENMCLRIQLTDSLSSVGHQPLIYVAAGCNEVTLWNAENGTRHQVLRTASYDSSSAHESRLRLSSNTSSRKDMRRNAISPYRLDELNESVSCLPGVRSLLPLPGGDLLTGGTDLKIRYWNFDSPVQSYCVSGPLAKGLGKDEYYDVKSYFGAKLVQEMTKRKPGGSSSRSLHQVAATDSAGCHRDAVLSMANVKLNQRLLISSSRDGAIKVWK